MESTQTEFEKYLVEADKQVKKYIEKEARWFNKEQKSSWKRPAKAFPNCMRAGSSMPPSAVYCFFDVPEDDAFLKLIVWPETPVYILCRLKIENIPYNHDAHLPLVPGLLAVLVNYFLEKGYTPLADQKEKHNV